MTDLTPAKPLTAAQRAASDPAHSAWVSANAGTGKTQVLTARILRLLLIRVPPSEILCLTYTKAAAAEMRNRLNARLAAWAAMTPGDLTRDLTGLLGAAPDADRLTEARRLFAVVSEAPDGVKIRTIHAFCESLLGRFPLEAGLAPHFQVIDENGARARLREARDRLIDDMAREPDSENAAAFNLLITRLDETAFERLIEALSERRQILDRHLRRAGGGLARLLADVHDRLSVAPGMTEADVVRDAPPADTDGLRLAVELLRTRSEKKTDAGLADKLDAWLKQSPEDRVKGFFDKDGYASAFLTNTGQPRADRAMGTKTLRTAAPEITPILFTERERVAGVSDRRRALDMAKMTAAALRVGAAVINHYQVIKTQRAELDYDDLIARALDLLDDGSGASWVHFKLDGGVAHILLDEAQDTTPDQWRLLSLLSADFFTGLGAWPEDKRENRTFFVVGDRKQSIFSFQGADPEGFDGERARLAARLKQSGRDARFVDPPIQLALSFRSVDAVMRAVDAVFSEPGARSGLVAETSPTAQQIIRHQTHRASAPGLVELWPPVEADEGDAPEDIDNPVDQPPSGNAPELLSQRVARRIKDWLQTGETLASQGRPVRPGDILILLRDRRQMAGPLIRALKQLNVPVAGSDRLRLTGHIAVMDLIALGRFALLPDDDLTLAAVLKSPFAGLTDDDLIALAPGRPGSLWRALRARAGERAAWGGAAAFLKRVLADADQAPPFEFYQSVLTGLGGGKALLSRLGPDAEDPIDEFLSQALGYERDNPPSLEGFLHHLRIGKPVVKREMDATDDAVRVMTVHGAKGLEAPIVFLVNNKVRARRGGGGPKAPPFYLDPGPNPDAPPLPFLSVSKADAPEYGLKLRDDFETASAREDRRLLYVGLTRAADRLYVVGHGAPADDGWHAMTRAGLEADGAAKTFERDGGIFYRLRTGKADTSPVAREAAEPSVQALPGWAAAAPAAEPDPPAPLVPSRPDDEPAGQSPLAGGKRDRFKRGHLIHKLLQFLPDLAGAERERRAAAYLARPTHGLSGGEQSEILEETLAVLSDPAASPLFGPGSRAEASLTGLVNGRVISARVDRLLVSGNEVAVLDYKTNRPPPRRARDVPPVYLKQMAGYRSALQAIYPGKTVRCVLLWTDGPRLTPLPDDLLDHVDDIGDRRA